jgi:hypothetical protein
VSVVLSGSAVLTEVVYPTISPYIEVAPASYPVEIVPTGTSSPAITGTAVVSGFTDFTFAAVGNADQQPLALVRLEDDNATLPISDTARLRITHAAPFTSGVASASVASTAVDICVTGTITPVITDLIYLESVTAELPAGLYNLFAAAGGSNCGAKLFSVPAIAAGAGDIAYAYAVGDGTNAALTVVGSPSLAAKLQLLPIAFRPLPNIVEVANAAGSFTTLLAALDAAGLTDTLRGPGPFTVFAPTDAAFAKIPPATLEALLADPQGQLTQILLYHVVSGQVLSTDLSNGQTAPTLQGATVAFTISGSSVKVNNANVITADVLASNGVIHVIDEVLLPPAN